MIDVNFWKNKRVLITGHTGFKGSWLCLWLHMLEAKVYGFALDPPTDPNLYNLAGIENLIEQSIIEDIRDSNGVLNAILDCKPDIIYHLAAQPIVGESYNNPIETYSTNVMGTVHLLEATRHCNSVKVVVNITSDKCYENREWPWGYRENDPLGGFDPYSNSKACSELVTSSFRNSFFNRSISTNNIAVATARAGNVIGGGDWGKERLIPDVMRALLNRKNVKIRNPHAIRPWQHVLDPLCGYLLLGQFLFNNPLLYAEAWNFGPDNIDAKPVEWVVRKVHEKWGSDAEYVTDTNNEFHEATYLKLDCSKSKARLGWYPKWNIDIAIDKAVQWTKAYSRGENIKEVCEYQIKEHLSNKN